MVPLPGLSRRYYLIRDHCEDALDNLTFIFECLQTYGLQLKSTKCHLFQTSVPFLGHVVAAAPSVHPSGSTAPRRERCWQLSPCVYSFFRTCAARGLPSGRITSLLFGSIALKTQGMMARRLHTLQQFQFSIVHRAGRNHSNTDGLYRVPASPCGQCTRVDCPQVDTAVEVADQPFDAESVGCRPRSHTVWGRLGGST